MRTIALVLAASATTVPASGHPAIHGTVATVLVLGNATYVIPTRTCPAIAGTTTGILGGAATVVSANIRAVCWAGAVVLGSVA